VQADDIFSILTVEQQEKAKQLEPQGQARAQERRQRTIDDPFGAVARGRSTNRKRLFPPPGATACDAYPPRRRALSSSQTHAGPDHAQI
jgi:hypothetical protein